MLRKPKIAVIGVGNCGCNIVTSLAETRLNVDKLMAINTDTLSLFSFPLHDRFLVGKTVTFGLGAGGDVVKGREAAIESLDELINDLVYFDVLIAICGLGKGTGGGATPVILKGVGKRNPNCFRLTVTVLPFRFEGGYRADLARTSLSEIEENSELVVLVKNDDIASVYGVLPSRYALACADTYLSVFLKALTLSLTTGDYIPRLGVEDLRSLSDLGKFCLVDYVSVKLENLNIIPELILHKLEIYDVNSLKGVLALLEGPAELPYSNVKGLIEALASRLSLERVYWSFKQVKANLVKLSYLGAGVKPSV